jgi:PPOX class probable F420-dependent enzyme
VLLTTYRPDGRPVGTPVNIAVDGERAFIRTYSRACKMKRIRRHREVEIEPSTWRGRPTGPKLRTHLAARTGHGSVFQQSAIAAVAYSSAPIGIVAFALILGPETRQP